MSHYLTPYRLYILYKTLMELIGKNPELNYYTKFRSARETISIFNRYGISRDYFFPIWETLKKSTEDTIILTLHQKVKDSKFKMYKDLSSTLMSESISEIEKKSNMHFDDFTKNGNEYTLTFKKTDTCRRIRLSKVNELVSTKVSYFIR